MLVSTPFCLDDQCFYGALVKQIKHLLTERNEVVKDSQWVLDEALNGRHLQSGGTFQNVLSRRIDEVVIPVFASIIAYVDQYSNLSTIREKYVMFIYLHLCLLCGCVYYACHVYMNDCPCNFVGIVHCHWSSSGFGFFSNDKFCQFSYEQIAMGKSSDTHPGAVHQTTSEFKCRFPFFWLFKECIDAKWDLAYAVVGKIMIGKH